MNANAKPFIFNPGASTWAPPSSTNDNAISTLPPNPPQEDEEGDEKVDEKNEGEDEIDENDPLWIVTLKIANGDRAAAIKMLEDPDELSKYPEIMAVMNAMDEAVDEKDKLIDEADWEKAEAELGEGISSLSLSVTAAAAASTVVSPKKSVIEKTQVVVPDDDIMNDVEEEATDADPREHLNIVFIGHVDAGKSTLSGSILYIMGQVDARTIERYEKEAKQRNRESWFLAFIMDTSEEERAKGKTVEVGRAFFTTEEKRYTILDAPGHKNYVPNMISGATQADVGVLVISARRGEFETGFEKGGQTREHALLAKTLGVRYLVVVINKMDDPTVEWSQERYEECVNKLKPFLKSCGYAIKKDVRFIPISGLSGDNVLKQVSPSVCPWWAECVATNAHNTNIATLIGTLDSLNISGRNADGPLRMPVLDRYFERGCVVMGKVESGTLRTGDDVMIMPTKKNVKVQAVYINEVKVRTAKPGENVLVKLDANVEDLQKGFVLCSPSAPCPAALEFKVQLALVDMVEHRPIFSSGYECMMHTHTAEAEITCTGISSVIDKKGNNARKPFALQGQTCIATMATTLSTCVDVYDDMPALGRVTLRDEGKTIAIGKVIEITKVL